MSELIMKKLLLVGNSSERPALIKLLNRQGCVEIVATPSILDTSFCDKTQAIEKIESDLTKLDFYFDIIRDNKVVAKSFAKEKLIQYTPIKKPPFSAMPELTFDQIEEANNFRAEIDASIAELEKLSSQLLEIKAQELKYQQLIEQVMPYKEVKSAINIFKDTKTVNVMLGTVPLSKVAMLARIEEKGGVCELYGENAVSIVIEKDKRDSITSDLSEMGFTACTLNLDIPPMDSINDSKLKLNELKKKRVQVVQDITKYENLEDKVKWLYDYFVLEKRKLECETTTRNTVSSYFLEAWLPAVKEEKVLKSLDGSNLTLAFETREPKDDELVPTLIENSGVVTPYQSVTNMFSAPSYGEIDPNPFVAFFFFLFFGMMLSDAGYGLVLTLATGIILAINRPPKGQANLIKIVFMGGISTIIWGVIFGSYFGVSASDIGMWYWFNPIEKPMNMLYLSLGMGIFQMCFGLGINMVALIKKKKPFQAFASAFSWYFLIIGIALAFGVGMLIKDNASLVSTLKTVGYVLLVLGLVLLMISGAINKKGAKKVTGAFGKLYDIVNFFSDLMSYTRIFGLGLATAVIGMVFNQIGMLIVDMVPIKFIGWIAACVIFLIGHVFNMAINALGAYVHNSRLQFVEFFGKFYSGGGEIFKPLGSEMKYYVVKNEEVIQK